MDFSLRRLFILTTFLFLKSEESRPAPKISPAKTSEPAVNLLGLGKYVFSGCCKIIQLNEMGPMNVLEIFMESS